MVSAMRHNPITIVLLLSSVALISGCATAPKPVHDSRFAPVYPVNEVPPIQNGGSIYQASGNVLLFEDQKAHRVGDLLTIILNEKTDATKKSSTATIKDSAVTMPSPTLFGAGVTYQGRNILNNSVEAGSSFTGDGSTKQSNSLESEITVSVVQVLANGNLLVRGEKVMTINDGDEFVRVSGIVRPVDISQENSVVSTKIANAEIVVGGNGTVANAGKMGWLSSFFNSTFWPF